MTTNLATAVAVAPASEGAQAAIDRDHLAQMTLGDANLEREILQLFDRQSQLLLDRMYQVPPTAVSALAHTIKGSARGIGAWRVARTAEAVELADGTLAEFQAALNDLSKAIGATRSAIGELLRTH